MTDWSEARPYGPAEHKAARRALGLGQVEDLLAVGRGVDPFYAGTPADWRNAEWFAGLWQQYGRRGMHLRSLHYVASQTGSTNADGSPYLNDKLHWGRFKRASEMARFLGLIDPEEMTDLRNGAVIENVHLRVDVEPEAEITRPAAILGPLRPERVVLPTGYLSVIRPEVSVSGYHAGWADQPVLLEVWMEKSSTSVMALCGQLGVNLKIGKGTESITSAVALLRRAEAAGKPIHVLYVADLDEQGRSMPVSVSRHCEFFSGKLGTGQPVTVERLALTPEQVEHYRLPQAPDTADTEVDALLGLYPGELENIIRAEVARWRDPGLPGRVRETATAAQRAAEQRLISAVDPILGGDEMRRLRQDARDVYGRLAGRLRPLAEQWEQAVSEMADEVAGIERRKNDLGQRLAAAVESIDWDLPDVPDAEPPGIDRARLLYDPGRHWTEQATVYRHHKRANGGGEAQ